MAENDKTATTEAMTVISATMPNAAWSLVLILNLPARRRWPHELRSLNEAPFAMRSSRSTLEDAFQVSDFKAQPGKGAMRGRLLQWQRTDVGAPTSVQAFPSWKAEQLWLTI